MKHGLVGHILRNYAEMRIAQYEVRGDEGVLGRCTQGGWAG